MNTKFLGHCRPRHEVFEVGTAELETGNAARGGDLPINNPPSPHARRDGHVCERFRSPSRTYIRLAQSSAFRVIDHAHWDTESFREFPHNICPFPRA